MADDALDPFNDAVDMVHLEYLGFNTKGVSSI